MWPTDRRTIRPTDRVTYRVACMRLKMGYFSHSAGASVFFIALTTCWTTRNPNTVMNFQFYPPMTPPSADESKNRSTSRVNISANSQPIFKNHTRTGIAKEFPTIWDFARLSSFICLEVMIKNMNFVLFKNQGNQEDFCFEETAQLPEAMTWPNLNWFLKTTWGLE